LKNRGTDLLHVSAALLCNSPAAAAFDGDLSSTWLDSKREDLIAHFHSPVRVATYEFNTGHDHDEWSGRIPVSWHLKARANDKYSLTFLKTGCCNTLAGAFHSLWLSHDDSTVFNHMYDQCTGVVDGTASLDMVALCGCGAKLPTNCALQTTFT